MANAYTITNDYREGAAVSITLSGQLSLDEMLDGMRGFMVACGFHPDTAKRLDIREDEDGAD